MTERIGFIGLGAMGLPVAINLRQMGFDVLGFDLDAGRAQALAAAGGAVANSLETLLRECDCLITMLPEGRHVDGIVDAFIAGAGAAKLFIDLSTIGIDYARRIQDKLAGAGVDFLEAPVTGGVKGAADGTLTIMVAGDEAVFEANRNLFEAFGTFIVYAGGTGCAQAVKLCNNMAAGIIKVAISEAFALSRRLGVRDDVMFQVASKGSANCFALTNTCPVPDLVATSPSSRGYVNGFATRLMLKDMMLAQSAASSSGVPVTVAAATASLYQHCCNNGMADLDNGIVFQFISRD
ncbi:MULTISPECIES: NAD(P)-dependent oxidoreductase [Cupriavidus]